jgi:hypothetical protein
MGGLLSKLLSFGERSDSTMVLLPREPHPDALLEIIRLADPEARVKRTGITTKHAHVGLVVETPPELAERAGVQGEFPYALAFHGKTFTPLSAFDLAQGVAIRLGGAVLDENGLDRVAEAPLDIAETVVYLPRRPPEEEAIALIRTYARGVDSLESFLAARNSESEEDEEDEEDGSDILESETFELRDRLVIGRVPEIDRVAYYDDEFWVITLPEKEPGKPAIGALRQAKEAFYCGVNARFEEGEEGVLRVASLALDFAKSYGGVALDFWGFRLQRPEDLLPGR